MKLLLDENLSWRLKKKLQNDFTIILHSNEIIPLNNCPKDMEIWNFAKQNNFLIITNDEDFSRISLTKGFPPKVILLRVGNLQTNIVSSILIQQKLTLEKFISNNESGILEIL